MGEPIIPKVVHSQPHYHIVFTPVSPHFWPTFTPFLPRFYPVKGKMTSSCLVFALLPVPLVNFTLNLPPWVKQGKTILPFFPSFIPVVEGCFTPFLLHQTFYPNFTPFSILWALLFPHFYPKGKTTLWLQLVWSLGLLVLGVGHNRGIHFAFPFV